ncbi:hypothetical protein P154DRAFT_539872 [Amniculicola lignicola CBS 123094]|uniref:Uncharacterized protein n=1 Tax=Amniculicola lignicola CBS 123094 TaxID=1392246 RepID=A0A6A5W8V2_9PLEO|nr:hypothetical protein P154DRAFT_539872 [Amniculicola lignicola CBS 123094]
MLVHTILKFCMALLFTAVVTSGLPQGTPSDEPPEAGVSTNNTDSSQEVTNAKVYYYLPLPGQPLYELHPLNGKCKRSRSTFNWFEITGRPRCWFFVDEGCQGKLLAKGDGRKPEKSRGQELWINGSEAQRKVFATTDRSFLYAPLSQFRHSSLLHPPQPTPSPGFTVTSRRLFPQSDPTMLHFTFMKASTALFFATSATAIPLDRTSSSLNSPTSILKKRETIPASAMLYTDPQFQKPGEPSYKEAIIHDWSKIYDMCSKQGYPFWWYEISGPVYCKFYEGGNCRGELLAEASGTGEPGKTKGVLRSKKGDPADSYKCWHE